MPGQKQTIRLQEKRVIAQNTLELLYQSENKLAFIPGQFYSFHFGHEALSKTRSYSAANPILQPQNNHELSIAVTLHPQGFASNRFLEAVPGDEIEVSGPFGNLILPKQLPATVFLVATGTGIAPFRSMFLQIEEFLAQGGVRFILAFGVRTRDDLLYDREFYQLSQTCEHFDYEVYLSRQDPLRSHEHSGRVTRLFGQHEITPENTLAYVCGNPEMVDDVVAGFQTCGLTTRQIRREKYTLSPF